MARLRCRGYAPLLSLLLARGALSADSPGLPFVINTWGGPFTAATDAAFDALTLGTEISALDAVEIGCATCEVSQCDGTVGFGGSPDENCETTLDALIMDGTTMNVGAVAALRRVRNAIAVARRVLEHTAHTLLAGDQATRFAVENGFAEEDTDTDESRRLCEEWKRGNCQTNFRVNVSPDPAKSCGPYSPLPPVVHLPGVPAIAEAVQRTSHDTISLIAIDASGAMAAGTSTNGASHKIPGRVGDGPIAGSGSYVDGEVGGCGATGDGDIMMRFLPCYQAVESLRRGYTPQEAAEDAVRRMVRKYPQVMSGIVVTDNRGRHGAAASGWTFTYAFRGGNMTATEVVTVQPVGPQPSALVYREPNGLSESQKAL
ncbi:hypothetical protein GQ53DRAFT_742332 [Thozetella sp. PMI_491]|nr:hypothetical protein GQ53DRAFT_742332 [Thozetella sp. PMI_491]